ncbi:bifunctional 2-polyprenyl-6-hydroxyphenol methylase/3-demethylubiquinol 3-O-methyltransferase UbiG [Paenisporosarcina sp. TG20]|uniref:class I SAM-dependent methyltransferase n=1 Tax=Paenisporosarcina sp. TG20 TaxID=1211706 RepID=UPI0002FFD3F3|nr:class I SAM-dependent methyltransferase [Paenisporosarcina sp. TG20]
MTNQWDKRFQIDDYLFGKEANEFIKYCYEHIQLNGDNTLAIAEGEGRNAVFVAKKGFNVTTWDYSQVGLEKTRELAMENGVVVQTEQVDLNDAPWEESQWDQIFCVFGHFPEKLRESTLTNIKKALKPGGHFITEVYSIHQVPYKSGGPGDVSLLYAPDEFFKPFIDWRIIHFFMGEVMRHEGTHRGLSHVIQLSVQKPFN